MAKIIRIDKGDGSESEVDLAAVARIIDDNYRRPDEARAEFDAGQRVASPFAYYEIREDPADLAAMAAEAENDAVLDLTGNILKLKNKLARARGFAGQAESSYGSKYTGLMDALEAARNTWESENSLIVAEYNRTKAAVEAADKELRAELVKFYEATKEKRFDEHLSVRVNVKLTYELEKATDWAKTNAPYMLIADKSQFEKHAKDKKVSLDFVTKKDEPTGVIATALPVVEDVQIDEQWAGENVPAAAGIWVVPSEQGAG